MIMIFAVALVSIGLWFAAQVIVDGLPKRRQPEFRFRPVTDEFAVAVELLHRARFEVGTNLKKEINSFLTGHKS